MAYLESACAGNDDLHAEVLRLLDHDHAAGDFLLNALVLPEAQPDFEEELSRVVGDVAARQVAIDGAQPRLDRGEPLLARGLCGHDGFNLGALELSLSDAGEPTTPTAVLLLLGEHPIHPLGAAPSIAFGFDPRPR
jgi:hypothetical protein